MNGGSDNEDDQTPRVEKRETSTMLTTCCEVEPDIGLAHSECPGCGRLDPDTIRRVMVEREVVDDDR